MTRRRPVIADPWPSYERMREAGRVVWNEYLHGWMVTGFDDCREILTDEGERFSAVPADLTFAGAGLKAGDVIHAVISAANRDPSRWDAPGAFDIRRPRRAHFGFGHGSHLCLGAPLARLQAKVALNALLKVAPDFRLRGIDLGPSFFVRGPQRGFLDVTAPV